MTPLQERAAEVRAKGDVVGQYKELWLFLDALTDEQRATEEADAIADDGVDIEHALTPAERLIVEAWHREHHTDPHAPRTPVTELSPAMQKLLQESFLKELTQPSPSIRFGVVQVVEAKGKSDDDNEDEALRDLRALRAQVRAPHVPSRLPPRREDHLPRVRRSWAPRQVRRAAAGGEGRGTRDEALPHDRLLRRGRARHDGPLRLLELLGRPHRGTRLGDGAGGLPGAAMSKRAYVPFDRDPRYAVLREIRAREANVGTAAVLGRRDFFWDALLALPFAEVGAAVASRGGDFLDSGSVNILRERVHPSHRKVFGHVRQSFGPGCEWSMPGLLSWELVMAMLPGTSMDARRGKSSKEYQAALSLMLVAGDTGGREFILSLMMFLQAFPDMDSPTPQLWRAAFDFAVETLP